MREEVLRAALAGLLHDVGKFAQRAGWRKGKHAEVGGEFAQEHVPPQWHEGLYPIMGHHDRPLQGYETKVVALADRLSAGERKDEAEEQPQQLLSVFCQLETRSPDGTYQRTPVSSYWPLAPLALSRDVLFPGPEAPVQDMEKGYAELWRGFEADAERLKQAHMEEGRLSVYLENLLLIMQRYTWCVPSAYYRSLPDVSLYDHSRMTAALAACLMGTSEDVLDTLLGGPHQEAPAALLVGGDISGVQSFLYTITAQGATSALRGRSFYLQLLTEAVARFVLRRLDLPIANLIYQGGGAFYLLARAGDEQRFQEIQREISHVLLAHHRGDLYVGLAGELLQAADFYDGRISDRWQDLARRLRAIKQCRFAELGDGMADLFRPQGDGGNEARQCQVCGQEHAGTEEHDGVRKCPPCRSYEDLGKDLRQAAYLTIEEMETSVPESPLTVVPAGWTEALESLGMRAGLWQDVPRCGDSPHLALALNDETLDAVEPLYCRAVGRRFLVNVTPLITRAEIERYPNLVEKDQKEGDVKPFSVLETQSRGIQRLGVLRMDVDNLGDLFATGFAQHDEKGSEVERIATLSRVAALSFAISLYFEGWVGRLAAEMNARARSEGRGDALYSIYSGGDDLFFVGSWDVVVELARRIRGDLAPFAANHPGLHASAGVVLVGGKYPLAQAAEEARKAEEGAKGHEGKDAISFLGRVTPWERFGLAECSSQDLDHVHGLMHYLEELTDMGGPQALLRLLMRVEEQHEVAASERRVRGEDVNLVGQQQVLYGPWIWRGYYSLRRMADRYKNRPDVKKGIDNLAESLHEDNFRAVEWIGLAARWADLLRR